MLDTKDLKLSRMYFKSLHILRIFEINIRQTLQDINRWETLYTLPEYYDSDGLLLARGRKMTGGAIAEQITSFTELLERVRDKQEEIKTLRDGVGLPFARYG